MKNRNSEDFVHVYSTENGIINNMKTQQKKKSHIRTKTNTPNDGIVRIGRETKGRKGKGVTVISGLEKNNLKTKELAKTLKQKCGSGGTVKNDRIEIQGDHRDILEKFLNDSGYKVKRTGG